MKLRRYSKISKDLKLEIIMCVFREIITNKDVNLGSTSGPDNLGTGLCREIADRFGVNIYKPEIIGILCDIDDMVTKKIRREIPLID